MKAAAIGKLRGKRSGELHIEDSLKERSPPNLVDGVVSSASL